MPQEQLAEGKKLAWAMLEQLAKEFAVPLDELRWEQTDREFDFQRWSIVNSKDMSVLVKLEQNDLQDCPTDESRRAKVEAVLHQAVRSRYARKQTTSGSRLIGM